MLWPQPVKSFAVAKLLELELRTQQNFRIMDTVGFVTTCKSMDEIKTKRS